MSYSGSNIKMNTTKKLSSQQKRKIKLSSRQPHESVFIDNAHIAKQSQFEFLQPCKLYDVLS
jgi:hypothetical protein